MDGQTGSGLTTHDILCPPSYMEAITPCMEDLPHSKRMSKVGKADMNRECDDTRAYNSHNHLLDLCALSIAEGAGSKAAPTPPKVLNMFPTTPNIQGYESLQRVGGVGNFCFISCSSHKKGCHSKLSALLPSFSGLHLRGLTFVLLHISVLLNYSCLTRMWEDTYFRFRGKSTERSFEFHTRLKTDLNVNNANNKRRPIILRVLLYLNLIVLHC